MAESIPGLIKTFKIRALASALGRMQPMSETNVVLFIYDNCLESDCLPAVQLTVPLLQLYTCAQLFTT
jgi:hypothetical protein